MVLHDQNLEKFKNQLPCSSCDYVKICKFAENPAIKPIELPSNFSITISCKEQEKLLKSTTHTKGGIPNEL